MRQIDPGLVAGGRVEVERERFAVAKVAPFGNIADTKFRPLQIDENADRAADFLFERADHRDPLAHAVVRGMAHVDAEDVRPRLEQLRENLAIGRSGAERGDDLDAAATTRMQGSPARIEAAITDRT